jgi:predicted acylesterase/phospholipase RssA
MHTNTSPDLNKNTIVCEHNHENTNMFDTIIGESIPTYIHSSDSSVESSENYSTDVYLYSDDRIETKCSIEEHTQLSVGLPFDNSNSVPVELNAKNKSTPKDTIRHIVISGGGTFLFTAYGALKKSFQHGFWNYEKLETIYGTSAGAIVGFFISLKMDWEQIDAYLINRQWQNIFKIDIFNIMGAYSNCGILDKQVMEDVFGPLLRYKGLNVDSTMLDLYNLSGIELHVFSTVIGNTVNESMKLVDISYKTHPEWKITDAVYASACLPVLFKPFRCGGNTYIDGSVVSSYPLKECYKNASSKNEIFGIKKKSNPMDMGLENVILTEYLYKLISIFIQKLTSSESHITSDTGIETIKHQLILHADAISLADIYKVTNSVEIRRQLIMNGEEGWCKYSGNSNAMNVLEKEMDWKEITLEEDDVG